MKVTKVNWENCMIPLIPSEMQKLDVGKYIIQLMEVYTKVVGYDKEKMQTLEETTTQYSVECLVINQATNCKVGTIGEEFVHDCRNKTITKITKLEF